VEGGAHLQILVVGGGGREHAVVWKLSKSPRVDKIYCAPGNAGTSLLAENVSITATDVSGIVSFAKEKQLDLVVVTPDDPLALGLVDALMEEGIRAFGPTKTAAQIEWSKAFSKEFMKRNRIPTADYAVFTDPQRAVSHLTTCSFPIVIKADGLALGKGVFIATHLEEAVHAVHEMMLAKRFGNSGSSIVIEAFLTGKEVSVLAFTDGKSLVPMVSSQDHKRAWDGDLGPNTGGMGAISPSPYYTKEIADTCHSKIFMPTIQAMEKEGRPFKGVLYFGLILTEDGPKVLEYNARFGDPETQAILPLLETDLLDVLEAVIDEKLSLLDIHFKKKASVCVVMASGGYPNAYEVGYPILLEPDLLRDDGIFHSGTAIKEGVLKTQGGRVLAVTALGETLQEAAREAYSKVLKVHFENAYFRRDIGAQTD
jgi:phosphoribosylamine---glycine ligase